MFLDDTEACKELLDALWTDISTIRTIHKKDLFTYTPLSATFQDRDSPNLKSAQSAKQMADLSLAVK